jgi:hypothetical protein
MPDPVELDPLLFGTHSLRRTKATLIYHRTGNLRAVQILFVAKTATSGCRAARCCAALPTTAARTARLTIHIDNEELSLAEFGKLLRYYAGWGMRIAFVPEERVTENPKIVVRDPKKGRRR